MQDKVDDTCIDREDVPSSDSANMITTGSVCPKPEMQQPCFDQGRCSSTLVFTYIGSGCCSGLGTTGPAKDGKTWTLATSLHPTAHTPTAPMRGTWKTVSRAMTFTLQRCRCLAVAISVDLHHVNRESAVERKLTSQQHSRHQQSSPSYGHRRRNWPSLVINETAMIMMFILLFHANCLPRRRSYP